MLKSLLRVRALLLLSILTGSSRKKEAQSKGKLIGFAILMIFSIGSLGSYFYMIFSTLAGPFALMDLGWLYFAFAGTMALGLMLLGCALAAKSQLFEARDNDLLLSMPIPPTAILVSRMFLLWVIGLVCDLVVTIPALLCWQALSGAGVALALVLFLVFLPLLAMAAASLVGWLLHLVSAAFGHRSIVSILLSLALIAGYLVLNFRTNALLQALAADPSGLTGSLGAVAPLVWLGRAVTVPSVTDALLFALLCAVCFAAALGLLALTFLRTATNVRSAPKKKYVKREAHTHSADGALLRLELRHLFSSPAYLINSGLGAFLELVAAAAVIWKRADLLRAFSAGPVGALVPMLAVAILSFLQTTVLFTAPAISLEARTLWIARSMPLAPWQSLRAKLRMHLLVALPPCVLLALTVILALGIPAGMAPFVVLVPVLYSVLIALLGLVFNLRHPSFNWINETQAVKSSISVLLTMLVGLLSVAAPGVLYIVLRAPISGAVFCAALSAVLCIVCAVLYRSLRGRGTALYAAL